MPEYSVELPLWISDWWELGLSPDLLNQLADWQEVFDTNFDSMEGWRTETARESWKLEGDRLAGELRKALPSNIELHVDLWPVQPRRH